MKIKLALITLLLPTAVFAQAGKSQENAGYQGTTSATQGLGASNPNAGGTRVPPSQISGSGAPTAPISVGPSGQNPGGQRNSLPPGSGTPQPIGTVGAPIK
jgi:hypothetical protein